LTFFVDNAWFIRRDSWDARCALLQLGETLHGVVCADGAPGDALVVVGVVSPLLEVEPVRVVHGPFDAVAQGVLETERRHPAHLCHFVTGQTVAQVMPWARGMVVYLWVKG